MDNLVLWLVLGGTALLLLAMLAPWRSLRRDALDEVDVYRVLAGEADEGDGAEGGPTL